PGSQALGQGPDNWVEQHEPSHHGDEEEEGDRFLRHHRLPGGASRSASRCLASSRSAKSMRSLNSLTSVRSPCTSPTTSERSASSSARTSSGSAAPPWRLIRSATALPTGEMASRNRVPPPKIKVIARTSSIATPPVRLELTELVLRRQHLPQELSRELPPRPRDLLGRPLGDHR